MEISWVLIILTTALCISLLRRLLRSPSAAKLKLPPGPRTIPIIGSLLFLRKSNSGIGIEPILRKIRPQYGPIITLQVTSRPAVFVADRNLTHQALIHNGSVFSDRPPSLHITRINSSNQHIIASAVYGPTWRLLRRNLTSEILHPSRVKSYGPTRKRVLEILFRRLKSESQSRVVADHFQYAMFCLLGFMCFEDELNENQIKEIERVQRRSVANLNRFSILNFWPKSSTILFRNRWNEFLQLRKDQEHVLASLIRARKNSKPEKDCKFVLSYVDTLWDLEIPDDMGKQRKLSEDEMVSLCSEFLTAGIDTTATALQWIMANIVKNPRIQDEIFTEIKAVVDETEEEVKEEVLHKMPYLKAVILEGLRRHPPVHFVLPYAVTQDVVLGGHVVPKNGSVNFMVAEMGWDPEVWEDPMAFKPERFLNLGGGGGGFDLTGSREIKMMPFGVGRRICPGSGLAVLHLEYFVANLVWKLEWGGVEGDDVDLSEKQEFPFAVVMKNPLQAHLSPRIKCLKSI